MKLQIILALLRPLLEGAINLLRMKDENSTGLDDEAAEALDYALQRVMKYLGGATLPVILCLAFITGDAQSFRFNVSALNKEAYTPQVFNPRENVEYSHAISVEGEGTIASFGEIQVTGVGTYQRDFDTDVNTVLAGGRLRYKRSFFSPYAGFHVGFETLDGRDKEFCRELQFGIDLEFKRFTFRPFAYGQKRKGQFLSQAENRFYTGVGFNF